MPEPSKVRPTPRSSGAPTLGRTRSRSRTTPVVKTVAATSKQLDPESEPVPAKPFCMRRGAEVQTEQGERLFERSEC